jgi:hypothetical protein
VRRAVAAVGEPAVPREDLRTHAAPSPLHARNLARARGLHSHCVGG